MKNLSGEISLTTMFLLQVSAIVLLLIMFKLMDYLAVLTLRRNARQRKALKSKQA
jgi:hypothetical protein